ncbi:MAG: hypothetical protein FWD58_04455 [Firmicutes bacterium]|nr:hypothetical protein [Bacillota bacterium]
MADGDKLANLISSLTNSESGVLGLISTITDERSFVETDRFIGSDTELGVADGEGVVSGFATICDQQVAIFATNPAVLKGSIGKKGADKITRLVDNALKTQAPLIAILDTQGARLGEGIEAVEGYTRIINAFYNARYNIPIIVVNKGKNFGMSSYLSYVCDICIGYDKSELCTASPLVIAAKSKTDTSKIGTAAIHEKKTGLYSKVVKSDEELKEFLVKALDLLGNDDIEGKDDPNRTSLIPLEGAGAKVLIEEIFDKDSFLELKAGWAPEIVTGLARLDGMSVGVVAFNKEGGARLSAAGAEKIARLYRTCLETVSIPLITLVDCVGTETNIAEENGELLKNVTNLMSWATMEDSQKKIALITGNAFGVGYAAFASKSAADYTLAFPGAKIGAIESAAAAELMYDKDVAEAKNKDAVIKKMAAAYAEENQSAIVVAKSGYIDNIIEPAFSRPYLIQAVRMFKDK